MINKTELINKHNIIDTGKKVKEDNIKVEKAEKIESVKKFDRVEISNLRIEKDVNRQDISEIDRLRDENNKRIEKFKELIRSMITKQGEKSNLKLFGKDLTVTVEDSEKAKEAISEGREYSVEVVAGRIMDMAKALVGGNKIKIDLLRNAVKEGFKAAGLEFNGGAGLPDICNKTYDEVMKRFDEWEKE